MNIVASDNQNFLQNSWYVAGFIQELDEQKLLNRIILSNHVLLYRGQDGEPLAIGNICPHRFAPLHLGKLKDGKVQCAYHGLEFDGAGKCVHNPHGPTGSLKVPSYPLVERGGILWIWMGDENNFDTALIPEFERLDQDNFHVRYGYLHGRANYELMTDNILDLSHIEFLHPRLGTEAVSRAKVEVKEENGVIITSRTMRDEVLPAGLAKIYKSGDERVNRTMQVSWHAPANMVLQVTVEPVKADKTWKTGSQTLHLFTPETEHSTHYFYVASLPHSNADSDLADTFYAALGNAFTTEDKPMIDAQAQLLGNREIMDLKPAMLLTDKAAILARRKLASMIASEKNVG